MKTLMHQVLRRLQSAGRYAATHKLASGALVVVLAGGGWYLAHAGSTAASSRYMLGEAATSTIISTVSASGQVSSSDQVDVKAKVSGEITWIGAKPGDRVGAGEALAYLDASDAQQTLSNAQKSLEQDKLQYQKDSAQAPIDYQRDLDALDSAKEDLANAYNDAFNTLTDTYLDFPDVMTSAQNSLYGYDFDSKKSQWNMDVLMNLVEGRDTGTAADFRTNAKRDYDAARAAYDKSVSVYKTTTRTSSTASLESLLSGSIDMATAAAQALQSELNFYGAIADLAQTYDLKLPYNFSTLQSGVRSQLATANSDLSALLSQKKTITADKQAATTAQQNITLDQVGNQSGSNPISLQIAKNNIEKQEADLVQLQADLADYTVRAPFSGTVASVAAKKGDTASGALLSLITDGQLAELSLNEVDAAKIKLGNKATLTFDAIDTLTLTGTVAEIDSVGTVSQGVVSYTVKIRFDSQDARIKPGMTVNAQIQTAVRADVLVVPQSAIKTQGQLSYVLAFEPAVPQSDIDAAGAAGVAPAQAPVQIPVETGISDDTNIEILSGLRAGEQIVTGTRTATAKTSATTGAARTGGNATFTTGSVKAAGPGSATIIRGL